MILNHIPYFCPMNNHQTTHLPEFSDLHLVVIGDIMIDRYISGTVRRISPEAPVPVVDMDTIENRLGGAANVAMNLLALGAKVTLISITGDDDEGENFIHLCSAQGQLNHKILRIPGRKTTIKSRIMAGNQHLLRIDSEDRTELTKQTYDRIFHFFSGLSETTKIDGLILQDYNKGLLSEYLIHRLIEFCKSKNIATFVDPKEKNFFAYTGCTIFKPNKKEVQSATADFTNDYKTIAEKLQKQLQCDTVIITLGSMGIYICKDNNGHLYPTAPRVVADVCGAGDSVISIVALCYLKKVPIDDIGRIANIAGGQVCEIPGVGLVDRDKVLKELKLYKE